MISYLLKQTLDSHISYTELQKIIDTAIIEDQLPDNLSVEILNHIFDLQTDLELIAEYQATHMGTKSLLTQENIIEKLKTYHEKLSSG